MEGIAAGAGIVRVALLVTDRSEHRFGQCVTCGRGEICFVLIRALGALMEGIAFFIAGRRGDGDRDVGMLTRTVTGNYRGKRDKQTASDQDAK